MSTAWRHAAWVLAAAAALSPLALERLATPPPATRLVQAAFGQTVDDEGARRVALPHRWAQGPAESPNPDDVMACADCRTAWYHFDLPREAPPRDTLGLLLPRVGDNAAVYLNGRLLAQGGRFADPSARQGARPLFAEAPPALWGAGDNRLYVLVKADRPRAGLMPAPALAAATELRPVLAWRQALGVTLPQVAATASVMLALMMGVLWQQRRRETGYAALALAAAAVALQAFVGMVLEPPAPDRVWDALGAALALAASGAVLWLARQMAGPHAAAAPEPRHRVWVATLAAAAVGAALAAGDVAGRGPEMASAAAHAALALAGARLLAAGGPGGDSRLLVPGAMLAMAALLDGTRGWFGIGADGLPATPLALAVLLGVSAWTLLLRFVQTLNAVELLKIDLEGLVVERTAALQAQFERVRELERQQTVASERERLMRDMHDGVGGHLVAMLAMIEADRRRPGDLAVVVRDALDDMRLMIDSLEPVDDDLNAVLAMFNDRLAPRMRSAGVELHWEVDLLPSVAGLTPARVLHLLRILQEAVTNAIRHGRARTLWLSAHADDAQVGITVRDDGQGFDPAAASNGRGLKNMRRRAADAGLALRITSAPGAGATVGVTLAR